MLNIENATVVRGGKVILDNLSLSIADGEHIAIIGPNGSGKSTLIKLITRELYPLAGAGQNPVVELFGRDRWDVFELRSQLGILSADLHKSFTDDEGLEPLDVVLSGFFASKGVAGHQKVTSEMIDAARRAVTLAGADHLMAKLMHEMSTGEARRVLIARTLVAGPRAVILDEPTAGLDIASRRHFLHSIRSLTHHNKTLILVTHHVEEIIPEIDRIVLMKDGLIFKDGKKADVLSSRNLSELFNEPIELRESGGFYSAEIELLASDRIADLD